VVITLTRFKANADVRLSTGVQMLFKACLCQMLLRLKQSIHFFCTHIFLVPSEYKAIIYLTILLSFDWLRKQSQTKQV